MSYKISYGTREIYFSLERRKRKTLAIHVYPDQQVEIIAPVESSIDKIMEKMKKRSSWIYKRQLEFSRIQPAQPEPKYETGETFKYLGKQYRLKIIEGKTDVKLKNGRFIISFPTDSTSEQRKKQLLKWFRNKGEIIFMAQIKKCVNVASVIGVKELPDWQIKAMKKRWGSCTKEGKIYLNPELISAPKPCIDYVIYHELCHLIEHNHSLRFYNLLSKVYPNWKRWRDYLNENVEVRIV